MRNKYIQLIAGILGLAVFIGFLGETEPKNFFGLPLSIWVYRAAWLFISFSFFRNYLKLKKAEDKSST
jgi:hypothetical protein